MSVSVTWLETCSYPLLWKSLYFEEGWTVADEVIAEFERRLYRLQEQLDFQYHRLRFSHYSMDEYRNGGSPRSDSGEIDASRGSAQQHPPMSFEKSRLYDELFFNLDLLLNGSKTYSALKHIQSLDSKSANLFITRQCLSLTAMVQFDCISIGDTCMRIVVSSRIIGEPDGIKHVSWMVLLMYPHQPRGKEFIACISIANFWLQALAIIP
jgi:hypothetical protein